jgi:hypothetical protein
MAAPAVAFPDSLLFRPTELPFGKSWQDWTSAWWNWLLQIPKNRNPAEDQGGRYCDTDQYAYHRDVFFLAGAYSGRARRNCTSVKIPPDKGILCPIIIDEESELEKTTAGGGPGALRGYSTDDADKLISLELVLDEGTDLEQRFYTGFLSQFRVPVGPFDLKIELNNLFDLPVPPPAGGGTVGVTKAAADGYWFFLKPGWVNGKLGTHTIYFNGIEDDYSTEVTYNLNINP